MLRVVKRSRYSKIHVILKSRNDRQDQIAEVIMLHQDKNKEAAPVLKLKMVHFNRPCKRPPHQFRGMKQRNDSHCVSM